MSITEEIFLQYVHPRLHDQARTILTYTDSVERHGLMLRVLQLSLLVKIIHPSLLDDLEYLIEVPVAKFEAWQKELVDLHHQRTVVPNAVGQVSLAVPNDIENNAQLTAEEHAARTAGKLCGVLRNKQIGTHHFHVDMESFVHPTVWFQFDYDAKNKKFLSAHCVNNSSYFCMSGRLSTAGPSALRIRCIDNNRFRVEDDCDPDVWAEGNLPVYKDNSTSN